MSSQLNIDDVEKIRRVIVDPVVAALKAELEAQVKPLVTTDAAQETRIAALEKNQHRALMGWGIASIGFSAALTSAWQFLRSKIRIG